MADLSELRDQRQRTVGCLSFSMLVHSGLFALLILLPPSLPQKLVEGPLGSAGGSGTSTDPIDLVMPEPAGAPDQAPPPAQAPAAAQAQEEPKEIHLDKESPAVVQAVAAKSNSQPTPETEIKSAVATVPAQAKPNPKETKPQTKKASKAGVQTASLVAKSSEPQPVSPTSDEQAIFDDDSAIQSALKDARALSTRPRDARKIDPENEPGVETQDKREREQVADTDHQNESESESELEAEPEKVPPEVIAENEAPDLDAETRDEAKEAHNKQSQAPVSSQAQDNRNNQSDREDGQQGSTSAAPSVASGNGSSSSSQPSSAEGTRTGPAGRSKQGYEVPLGTQQIRDASELVAQPGNRPPTYPQQDRLLGRQGTAVVVGRVQPDGTVTDVYLEKRSGSPLMDQASMAAFKNWKFMPGQQGLVRKPFQFQLSGEAVPLPARLRR